MQSIRWLTETESMRLYCGEDVSCFVLFLKNNTTTSFVSFVLQVILFVFCLLIFIDEWSSIFGDFTKFGLGFFSIIFDCIFMVQHYVLYRRPKGYSKFGKDNPHDNEHTNENKPIYADTV